MAVFSIKNLSFTYPQKTRPALSSISMNVGCGEFISVCGQTGCGKTTLLRNLKTALAPHGKLEGKIMFYNRPLCEVGQREQSGRIGFVMQNPDAQIVTDKVWHELAFGLESLGYDKEIIRLKTAEMAAFFDMQSWFMKDVFHLSGGQKQLLNLASVMVLQPDVLILDEPTSQLDPIASENFLTTVQRINREIGTTVIISEHRLEKVLPMADRVTVLDKGCILADGKQDLIGRILAKRKHPMFFAMPTPMRIYGELEGETHGYECPVTIKEGRTFLKDVTGEKKLKITKIEDRKQKCQFGDAAATLSDVWFRYDKEKEDVIKGITYSIPKGRISCIVGGNGAGKSTALGIMSGVFAAYRGKVTIEGRDIRKYKGKELYNGIIGMLPQDPKSIFVEKTVRRELLEVQDQRRLSAEEAEGCAMEAAAKTELADLLDYHPYDLSGGEQQRLALAKVLLTNPGILIMDEPTKGLDEHFKRKLASMLTRLKNEGVAVLIATHDIEFCGKYADRCAMLFDGRIISEGTPGSLFSTSNFYTTAASRMSRHIFENAVTALDVVWLCRENMK